MEIVSAVGALRDAGIDTRTLAAELGVHPRTVARWTAGTNPRPANLVVLRLLVDELLAVVLAGDAIADGIQGAHLQRAKQALESDADRRDLDRLAAEVAATIEAANRRPYVPVTASADPFGLCRADDLDNKLDALLPLPTAA